MIRTSTLALAVGLLFASSRAAANPRPLPFSYPYETLPEGDTEIEQYVDTTPIRALVSSSEQRWANIYRFQTEFEYGITERLELGLYLQWVPRPEGLGVLATFPDGNGIKQRLRLRLADEGQWPVDVSVYGEVSELESEVELELKLNLQKRFDRARIMVNLWGEREFYYDGRKDWVLHPTAGLTYEVTPTFHPGVEYWMKAEYADDAPPTRPFNDGPHHFVGPTVMLSFGKLWWTTGVYVRASETNRTVQVGDNLGHVWVRSVIGIGL
jgi:hypothetical protein